MALVNDQHCIACKSALLLVTSVDQQLKYVQVTVSEMCSCCSEDLFQLANFNL